MGPILMLFSGMVAFAMAWAIGAQDVSNALGTSVGSKALSVRQAIYVGAACEFLGSMVGGEVAATISGGILKMDTFQFLGHDGPELYGRCMFVTMLGAFAWLGLATYFGLPVSTTHSLVGSLVGVGMMAMSVSGVNWSSVTRIVSSWLSSPLLGGIISYAVFSLIYTHVLTRPSPQKAARRVLPYFTGFTVGLLTAFVGVAGPKAYRVKPITAGAAGLAAAAVSIVLARAWGNRAGAEKRAREGPSAGGSGTGRVLKPVGRAFNRTPSSNAVRAMLTGPEDEKRLIANGSGSPSASGVAAAAADVEGGAGAGAEEDKAQVSPLQEAEAAFKSLMVLTACVVAFAHGSNDVSNSIGPFSALVEIYTNGDIKPGAAVPIWVLLCGGLGIVVGLGTYGYKVMATVGEKIAKLTFSRGFAAQIATAATVLTATQLGVSVSTTHCLIGAIAGVALVEGPDKLNKATLKKIALSWVVTLPAAATFSVILYVVGQAFWPIAGPEEMAAAIAKAGEAAAAAATGSSSGAGMAA